MKKYGKYRHDFITGLYRGDVGSGNIIKQIFQEIYLGGALFESTYNLTPQFYRDEGFILREKVIIDPPFLEELHQNHILAIATGRPAAEADYPLNHFQLKTYFSDIYTLDDCLREEHIIQKESGKKVSLSKPHPYMLDAIAEKIEEVVNGYYYVGDMPDDMQAAKNSRTGFKGIGILISASDKESLRKNLTQAGADFIVEDFNALLKLLE